ncbi:MAG: peptidoglycan DD-metalloendopeptidase family protein, partial [Candidatus Aminicenantes bacterium]|nr:peptidoglycan DD-metalloendopeptidase family protein [Candidatus Aminicenantes bacterium]
MIQIRRCKLPKLGGWLVLFIFVLPLWNQEVDVTEYEKRLQDLTSEIQALRNKIAREERKESSILAQLGTLGLEKKLIQNEIDMFDMQKDRANGELSQIRSRIPQLETKLSREQEAIAEILVSIYKFGKFNYFELLLEADNISNLLSENKNLLMLAEHQEKVIADYQETLDELERSREQLEEKRTEINQLIGKAHDKEQEMKAQERRNQTLISQINQNKQTFEKAIQEKLERSQQLHELMKKLLEEKIDMPFPLTPLDENFGKLNWPILGRVVTRFGVIRQPPYNTRIKSNGIEISPSDNMIVKNIHPGMVKFADYFEGYGNLIIIEHGMSFYSLYGHCADFYVKKGDAVREGDPIAYVGDIGSLKGDTLYFEIRRRHEA